MMQWLFSKRKKIAFSGAKYYIEAVNMLTTNDALNFLMEQKHMIIARSKAVNAVCVSTSELVMSQNSQRLSWSEAEVDEKPHTIMKNIRDSSTKATKVNGIGCNLVAGGKHRELC